MDRQLELTRVANEPLVDAQGQQTMLREMIRDSGEIPWPERRQAFAPLDHRKLEIEHRRLSMDRSLDTSWFLTDRSGRQIWRYPFNEDVIDRIYAWRDYFHGHDKEYAPDAVPAGIQPITQPHISLAFPSVATNRYMVAISVPVWDKAHETVIGVLARTAHLEQLLADYDTEIRQPDSARVDRIIALADRRDGILLGHPWMTPRKTEDETGQQPTPASAALTLGEDLVRRLNTVGRNNQGGLKNTKLDFTVENYIDPAEKQDSDYAGPWLAAFSSVGRTNWAAIVQEQRAAAWEPVEEMQQRLERYGAWALAACCALIGVLWYFVYRTLSERGLRDWPKSATNSTSETGSAK